MVRAKAPSGFSATALRYLKLSYLGYPTLLENHHALRDDLTVTREWQPGLPHSGLAWTHYRAQPGTEQNLVG